MILTPWRANAPGRPRPGRPRATRPATTADLEKGVAWPNPRFTDNSNGTVTDNLTGLIWLKNANCFSTQTWANALTSANALNSGECGLNDGSVEGAWRLPNVRELQSLMDYGRYNPALPSGHPFTVIEPVYYWTSSTNADYASYAWVVDPYYGYVTTTEKPNGYQGVWPVRGGQ